MKTILFDMYGVIIEESKGNFIPYTFNHFPVAEHERITRLFREEKLFTKAGNGELTSDEFLRRLGYTDTAFHMRDYLENHLTLDDGFIPFCEAKRGKYHFALLSNDVSAWSKHITAHHKLDAFLPVKIVSADVHCRKPEAQIFEIALETLGVPAAECVFIDNNVENLRTAQSFGMDTILFNRDGEDYDGKIVNSFAELAEELAQTL